MSTDDRKLSAESDGLGGRAGVRVCIRDNPGRQGHTTGRTKTAGTKELIEIEFGPNDKQFKNVALIMEVAESHDPASLLAAGHFGNASDLRRTLTFEKIKGTLTNIFYSMESSNTDFYLHQFKPVLNFIESPVGRLLIADEVGLGKTIEAAYIWKEVQARQGAKRLLIVCPAMLREKWRRDLRDRFNISSEIVNASQLIQRLSDVAGNQNQDSFVLIAGLEAIRAPVGFEDETKTSARAKLARFLDANPARPDHALLDQVVIDEAHYLRNPATGNNRVGRLLRDASQNLVLLTATPIQLGSENLYQLMRLIDPDVFYDPTSFDNIVNANAYIVDAQRSLWRTPPDIMRARKSIAKAQKTDFFRDDVALNRLHDELTQKSFTQEKRINVLSKLESRSLLSQYMSRSRKREVMKDRVERSPQVLKIAFNPLELSLYETVSRRIQAEAEGKSIINVFSLMARQRQMASSIVGALESWQNTGVINELLDEDLGILKTENYIEPNNPPEFLDLVAGLSVRELEEQDSKYLALRDFFTRTIAENPTEKFVLFAFFKGTLNYLHRRLSADGVRAALLHGDITEDRSALIDNFASQHGPNVLLSSEVGSEGIDLQFCRFLVNYDLPWNPMRVEQRIGRLDRLGQKSERISIINLQVINTIEDRIIMRLYDRINVFRESIGDLEDILGEMTEKLVLGLLNPTLTPAERELKADASAAALANRKAQQEKLEEEAVNLVGFSDYILSQINEGRENGHWLDANELVSFVEDFFAKFHPGTVIETNEDLNCRQIMLADTAKIGLGNYLRRENPSTPTRLHHTQQPIQCIFDPRKSRRLPTGAEFIDTTHPLIQWIKEAYLNDRERIYPVSAIHIDRSLSGLSTGIFVYAVQRWVLEGVKNESELTFAAIRIGTDEPLSSREAETLVVHAARKGTSIANPSNAFADFALIKDYALLCEKILDAEFDTKSIDFEQENQLRCNQQETSARRYAERRLDELEQRVSKFHTEGNERMIPATQGLIKRENEQLGQKLARIQSLREVDLTTSTLALGVIKVG